jgi:hypothetical protein
MYPNNLDSGIVVSMMLNKAYADNVDEYFKIMTVLGTAVDQSNLNSLASTFIRDDKFSRVDISLAIHTVELARGWK